MTGGRDGRRRDEANRYETRTVTACDVTAADANLDANTDADQYRSMHGMGKDDPHAVKTTLTLAERGATTEATLRLLFGSKEEKDEKVAKYYAAEGARGSLDSLATWVAAHAH